MTDEHLDEAIDRAVQEMMRVDPRPGLSLRVRARLDEPRAPWLTVSRLAASAAVVLAAVVAIVLVTRTPAPVPQQVSVAPAPVPPARQRDVRVPPSSPETALIATHVPRAPRTPSQRRVTPEDIPAFVSSVKVEPLASPPPIAMQPLDARAMESPEITVPPLEPLEPLRLDPLSSTPR